MLIKANKNISFTKEEPFQLSIEKSLKEKINKYWEEFLKDEKGYWDGDILIVTDYDLEKYKFKISKCKYSEFLYAKTYKEFVVRVLFTSILFKTLDNKYVVIKNNHNLLNIIGGIADLNDFKDEVFIPEFCLKRETLEELGIDIDDKRFVLNYQFKYIKIPELKKSNYTMGIVYTGLINLTSFELLEYIKNSKVDEEIKELYFLTGEDILNLKLNDKAIIPFLKELIELENSIN